MNLHGPKVVRELVDSDSVLLEQLPELDYMLVHLLVLIKANIITRTHRILALSARLDVLPVLEIQLIDGVHVRQPLLNRQFRLLQTLGVRTIVLLACGIDALIVSQLILFTV